MNLNVIQREKVVKCLTEQVISGHNETVVVNKVASFLTDVYRFKYDEALKYSSKLYKGYSTLIKLRSK